MVLSLESELEDSNEYGLTETVREVLGFFEEDSPIACTLCMVNIAVTRSIFNFRPLIHLVGNLAKNDFCPKFVRNGTVVCPGLVDQMVGAAIKGLSGSFLEPKYYCENYIPICSKQTFKRHLA